MGRIERGRVAVALVVWLLMAVGCGARRTETSQATGEAAAPAETLHAAVPSTPPAESPASAAAAAPRAGAPPVRAAEVDQILGAVRAAGGHAVVLNVWATWCAPCREEFPDLVRLHRQYRDRGMELMLVSADFDDRLPDVRRFLTRQGVDFPSFIKSGDDMKFINGLSPEWTGALPATFIYDGEGRLRWFHEGKATFTQLEKQLLEVIEPGKARSPQEERS